MPLELKLVRVNQLTWPTIEQTKVVVKRVPAAGAQPEIARLTGR